LRFELERAETGGLGRLGGSAVPETTIEGFRFVMDAVRRAAEIAPGAD
jgi:hypothetical protein